MQAGDYGERRSEPWTYRKRIVPLRTYSGRVVHDRKKHFFRVEDAQRILAKIVPPENEDGDTWAQKVIATLREATIAMLGRILPFLSEYQVSGLYEFSIELLDKFFGVVSPSEKAGEVKARQLIMYIADRAGLTVTIKKG